MRKLIIATLYIALSLAVLPAFAQTVGSEGATSAFDNGASVEMPSPDATDGTTLGSVRVDNENIGQYIIDWILRGASFTEPESTLFGALSMILNSVALAFALVVLGKHGLQFATLTASKGVPGGSQLSGGVITVRSSVAIAMLSPIVANGFSPVQVGIQEATRFGAYIGDEAVMASAGYLTGDEKYGSNTSHTVTPVPLTGTSDVIWNVVLNETCHQAVIKHHKYDQVRGVATSESPATFTLSVTDEAIVYQWGWQDPTADKSINSLFEFHGKKEFDEKACGTVLVAIPSVLVDKVSADNMSLTVNVKTAEETLYKKQLETAHRAILQLRKDIQPTIKALFLDQIMIQEVSAIRYSGGTVKDVEAIYKSINKLASDINVDMPDYGAKLLQGDQTYLATLRTQGVTAAKYIADNAPKDKKGRTWDQGLEAQGFAALGSYYWVQLKTNMAIADLQRHLGTEGNMPYIFNPKEKRGIETLNQIRASDGFSEFVERLALLEKAYKAIRPNQDLDMDFSTVRQTADTGENQGVIHKLINAPGRMILGAIESSLIESTNNDIIINFSKIGIWITTATEALIVLYLASSIATKGALGSLVTAIPGVGGAISTLSSLLGPVVVMGVLAGLTFQYLLPTIPLIKWLVSLQSWGIMMFIAMIYGPIWMMSTAAASNEDWINDKTYDGFVVIAELILRPLLMVFGFYAAMMLMAVANIGARMAFSYLMSIANEGFIGIIGIFAVAVLSGFIAYKLIMRTFDLIHELPDFIIERMGGRPLGDAARDDTTSGATLIMGNIHTGATDAAKGMAKNKQKDIPPKD